MIILKRHGLKGVFSVTALIVIVLCAGCNGNPFAKQPNEASSSGENLASVGELTAQTFEKGTNFQVTATVQTLDDQRVHLVFTNRLGWVMHEYTADNGMTPSIRMIRMTKYYDLYLSHWRSETESERLVLHDLMEDQTQFELASHLPIQMEETDTFLLITLTDDLGDTQVHLFDKSRIQMHRIDSDTNEHIQSNFGDLRVCDWRSLYKLPRYLTACRDVEMTEDYYQPAHILFDGKSIWSDSGRSVRFRAKYNFPDVIFRDVEIFVFDTSTGGTACPSEPLAVVINHESTKVYGPFGNCMAQHGIRVEPTSDALHFMFQCGNTPECSNHGQEYAYQCTISTDLSKDMECSGDSYCGRYRPPEDEKQTIFKWDSAERKPVEIKHCKTSE